MSTAVALPRGVLLAFEGIDGCGKSTLAGRLHHRFSENGLDAVMRKEPTDGRWGRELKRIIAEGRSGISPAEELALFVKDRREHVLTGIGPDLAAGRLILLDRYFLSTAAYQGALGMDPDRILAENERFAPAPDLAFILELDAAVGLERITRGRGGKRSSFEKHAYLERVSRIFERLDRSYIRRVDANRDADGVENAVVGILRTEIPFLFHGEE